MLGNTALHITEWEWFKLQLRLRVLELSGKLFVTRYTFRNVEGRPPTDRFPKAELQCMFWCKTTEDLLKKKATKSEHWELYRTWIAWEERRLREDVATLPVLSKELDTRKHVVFTILHDYGGGSVAVCHFYDGTVYWDKPPDRVPD